MIDKYFDMEGKKRSADELEKVSDKQSVDLAVKSEKGLISRFKSALAGLFVSDEKPTIKLSEEDESRIQATMIKCADRLRFLHDKAEAQFTGPVFERIDRSGRMEEEYLVYDDVKEYMIYNCQTDPELWEVFDTYLQKIEDNSDAKKMFAHSGYFASTINIFGSYPRICSQVFLLIFRSELEKAQAILECSKMPGMSSEFGQSIVTKLLEHDSKTIKLFLDLIRQVPKKFIDNDSRADLLIEFARQHNDRADQTSSKEAAEYIVRKEAETHPYR